MKNRQLWRNDAEVISPRINKSAETVEIFHESDDSLNS